MVKKRLGQHFSGKGAIFTKTHAPKMLHLVWPAVNTAVEGYVFLALLSTLPKGNVHKLGGWTQTSTEVSPLNRMIYEQERRLMRGLCFNCGGGHWASSCDRPLEGVNYKCQSCSGNIVITSRGQSLPLKLLPPRSEPQKRPAPSNTHVGEPVAKAPRITTQPGRSSNVVVVCGRRYSTLSWFLGKANLIAKRPRKR